MSVAVVIPARLGSTRLPRKALAEIAGEPMVVHVWRRACQARGIAAVLVATDAEEIAAAVRAVGGEAVLTRPDHPSGTDRCAEVARGLDADGILNIQGDLPMLDPAHVETLARALATSGAPMVTLATPLGAGEAEREQVVKVVRSLAGDALYFSRAPVPHGGAGLRHIGMYGYRREFLFELGGLAPTPLERAEKLEQLRVLEHGFRLHVAVVAAGRDMIEVDTAEDLARARVALAQGEQGAHESA